MRSSRILMLVGLLGCGAGPAPSEPAPPVTPTPSLPVLTALSIVLQALELPAGARAAATVTAVDERGRPMEVGVVAWTSSEPGIARIGSDGVILGLSPGAASIRATVGDVSAQRQLRVGPLPPGPIPVTTVAVTPVALSLQVGEASGLSVTLSDFAGRVLSDRAVSWSTSNGAVASISDAGVVIAHGPGIAVIEALSESARGATQVTVTPALDTGIVIRIALPFPNTVVEDSVTVVTTVRAIFPVARVFATISGREYPMTFGNIPKSEKGPVWSVLADISTIAFGPHVVIVTGIDSLGNRSQLSVPFVRDPRVAGGTKAPPRSK